MLAGRIESRRGAATQPRDPGSAGPHTLTRLLRGARLATGAAPDDDVVFFQTGGMIVALWGRAELAEDSGVEDGGGWGGVTLAYNVRSPAEVDAVIAEAEAAGATIPRHGAETFWGGYSGVFVDPDGHPWEVAHNPGWTIADDGSISLAKVLGGREDAEGVQGQQVARARAPVDDLDVASLRPGRLPPARARGASVRRRAGAPPAVPARRPPAGRPPGPSSPARRERGRSRSARTAAGASRRTRAGSARRSRACETVGARAGAPPCARLRPSPPSPRWRPSTRAGPTSAAATR